MSISSGCISTATLELWHRIRYLKAEEEKMDKKGSKPGTFGNLTIKDIVNFKILPLKFYALTLCEIFISKLFKNVTNKDITVATYTPNSDTYQKSDTFSASRKCHYYEWGQYSNTQKTKFWNLLLKLFLIHNETSHVIAASMAAYFFDLILFDLMGWQIQI